MCADSQGNDGQIGPFATHDRLAEGNRRGLVRHLPLGAVRAAVAYGQSPVVCHASTWRLDSTYP